MRIRLTCPKCSAAKTLDVRPLDIGRRIRTRCACGQVIEARPTGKTETTGRIMESLRGIRSALSEFGA
jgi:uncharacterized Zn finger protein